MDRLPYDLDSVTWMIVNQDESETFFGVEVKTNEDFSNLVYRCIAVGIENVVITRGAKGSIYGNRQGVRHTFESPVVDKVVDVTGAGDAYASGIIYGHLKGYDPKESIQFGMT